jgi:hypothetical protein
MRTLLAFALLGILLPLAPTAAATPTCQVLDRVQSVAGVQLHAHTESCTDSYSYYGYTTYTWSNVTLVEATGPAGHPAVYDTNYHTITIDPNGGVSEYRSHNYVVNDAPAANPAVSAMQVGVSNYQQAYNGNCYESTGAGAYSYGASQSGGVGQSVNGGSDPSYVEPCTSSDVQSLLP